MAPIFVLADNANAQFQQGAAGKAGVTIRGTWDKVRKGDFSDYKPYLALLAKGTLIHLGMSSLPCPADILSVTIKGQAQPMSFVPGVYTAFLNDYEALANWVVQQGFVVHGARVCPQVTQAGGAEFGFVGAGNADDETIWAKAGYRPSLVFDAMAAISVGMGVFAPLQSLAFLDPRTSALRIDDSGNLLDVPDKDWAFEIVDAMVARVGQGIVAPLDTNLGLHPVSPTCLDLAEQTGLLAVQLHVTVGNADVQKWLQTADEAGPSWIELHQNQAIGL
jgi:hypothetical protein